MQIIIEAVGKFGVKAEGKWFGVKRPIKPTDFVVGSMYDIVTEPWEAKGKSGINIVKANEASAAKAPEPEPVKVAPVNQKAEVNKAPISDYEANKNRRILRQGVYQAVVQSPGIAGLGYTTIPELIANVREVSEQLIKLIEG